MPKVVGLQLNGGDRERCSDAGLDWRSRTRSSPSGRAGCRDLAEPEAGERGRQGHDGEPARLEGRQSVFDGPGRRSAWIRDSPLAALDERRLRSSSPAIVDSSERRASSSLRTRRGGAGRRSGSTVEISVSKARSRRRSRAWSARTRPSAQEALQGAGFGVERHRASRRDQRTRTPSSRPGSVRAGSEVDPGSDGDDLVGRFILEGAAAGGAAPAEPAPAEAAPEAGGDAASATAGEPAPRRRALGGRSSEHEISVASAAPCSRGWRRPASTPSRSRSRARADGARPGADAAIEAAVENEGPPCRIASHPGDPPGPPSSAPSTSSSPCCTARSARTAPSRACSSSPDVAYVGPGVAASAVAMDKDLFKAVMRDNGRPGDAERRPSCAPGTPPTARNPFGFPVVVKPARLGSSVGITVARHSAELEPALELAFAHDEKVLARGVRARVRRSSAACSGTTSPSRRSSARSCR